MSPHHKEKECLCKDLVCGKMGNGVECSCHCHKEKEELKAILGEHAVIDYERNHSHYHCWHQSQPPACGIPLGKHIRCCLCDAPIPEKCKNCKWNGVQHDLKSGDIIHTNEDGSCAVCGRQRDHWNPTPIPVEGLMAGYNMPSIEKDGHHWIRMVDHINLVSSDRQAYKDSLREKVVRFKKEEKGHWECKDAEELNDLEVIHSYNSALSDILNALDEK